MYEPYITVLPNLVIFFSVLMWQACSVLQQVSDSVIGSSCSQCMHTCISVCEFLGAHERVMFDQDNHDRAVHSACVIHNVQTSFWAT